MPGALGTVGAPATVGPLNGVTVVAVTEGDTGTGTRTDDSGSTGPGELADVDADALSSLAALDQPPYEPYEFGGLEGLGEEGVDPDVESALHLVLGAGADDGERETAGTGIGTEPSGGPEPVEARHHHVEGDHIGPNLMDDVQTFGTISRGHDLETLQFEIDPDQLPDDLVVVHNKHPAGRAWHNSRVGPGAGHRVRVFPTSAP